MLLAGVPIERVSIVLGHQSERVTGKHYNRWVRSRQEQLEADGVWCGLYFFLHFIPSIGFMIALVPPTLLALLMLGWRRALLVFGGPILTEMLGENVLKPVLLKKDLDIGLTEVTLSLVGGVSSLAQRERLCQFR